ncbi:MAG: DNA-binding response regulator, partial [candidate division Zixibacteria bacterium CG_4_9_14_3_um_filter_46_8]
REREILVMIAEGLSNKQIANKLFLSVKTIETHRTHLMEKLGAHEVTALVRYAIKSGMISI